jgi:HK97 family phage major capsid protein
MNLAEMLEKRAEIHGAMETLDVTAREEGRDLTTEERGEWDRLDGEFEALSERIERAQQLEARRQVLTASAGTLVGARGGEGRKAPTVLKIGRGDTEERALCHYLRTGDTGGLALAVHDGESRAYNDTDMNETTDADGAVLVPTPVVQSIITKRDERFLGPRLGIVRIPGKGKTVKQPYDDENDLEFSAVGEGSDISRDAPAVNDKELTLAKYAKYVELSWELLRDEDARLMDYLNNWVARGWAYTLNKLLVTEALANGTAGLTLDAAAAIGAAEVPELVGKLTAEYQDRAQWLMHQTTWAYIQGLSGDQFHFAPTPGATNRELWGFPLNLCSNVTAYQASAKSMIFGNYEFMGWREGFGLQMLRDPYTSAGKGQVKIYFYFDAVFGVLLAEAIQYATHPSA